MSSFNRLVSRHSIALTLSVAAIAATCLMRGQAEQWEPAASPFYMGRYYTNFNNLPTSGEVRTPWSDTYWPHKEGGIAYRWQSGEHPWSYYRFSLAELRRMSAEDIARLSPAEKFDIYRGLTDGPNSYPTTRYVNSYYANSNAPSWWGICHGWSPASLNHAQPVPVKVVSPVNGVTIDFGTSDVEALLSFYYGDAAYDVRNVSQSGSRCGDRGGCGKDMNPGSLHLILANQLGVMKQGFVGDMSRGTQVWNHPIYKFESRIGGDRRPHGNAAPGTVREVKVHTKIWYAVENQPHWSPVGTDSNTRNYDYWLELDAGGNIIGGKYVSIGGGGGKAPDFVWKVAPFNFTEVPGWAALNDIYRAQ